MCSILCRVLYAAHRELFAYFHSEIVGPKQDLFCNIYVLYVLEVFNQKLSFNSRSQKMLQIFRVIDSFGLFFSLKQVHQKQAPLSIGL